MSRVYLTAIAAIVLLATGAALSPAAHAAPGTAPFGCDARPGVTCFFKLFLGPRATRIVQLRSGMKVNIPGVNIGNDSYCVHVNQPPVPKCARTVINATYNH
jgi:hypothetical protein